MELKDIILYFSSIVVILGLLLYFASGSEINSTIDRFTNKISVFNGIFITFGIFLTFLIFQQNIDHHRNDTTVKIVMLSWVDIVKSLSTNYKDCPHFINSLFLDWQKKGATNGFYKNNVTPENDNWATVLYIATAIFQSWENYLTTSESDESDEVAWISVFLNWLYSPTLKVVWSQTRSCYSILTNRLGELFFKVTGENPIPKNNEEMVIIARKILNNPEYKDIILKRVNDFNMV